MPKDGSPAMKTYPHPCFVYAARYHPQKSLVVTGGFDRLIRIWNKDNEGANGQVGECFGFCIAWVAWFMLSREGEGVDGKGVGRRNGGEWMMGRRAKGRRGDRHEVSDK